MNADPFASFAILVVCTGNICRSPVGERLLSAALPASVVVRSAGTRALVGEPIAPPMVPLLSAAGAAVEDFSARRLTTDMVRDADLVLAMTKSHRREVVELFPAAVRRSFTLLELALLLKGVQSADLAPAGVTARLHEALTLAARKRSAPLESYDIADPYRRSLQTHQAVFAQIQQAVATLAQIIVGPSASAARATQPEDDQGVGSQNSAVARTPEVVAAETTRTLRTRRFSRPK